LTGLAAAAVSLSGSLSLPVEEVALLAAKEPALLALQPRAIAATLDALRSVLPGGMTELQVGDRALLERRGRGFSLPPCGTVVGKRKGG
jgi:hypothetical protein